ncbi:MAG: ATP-dependent DNA ligase [Ornithinimicrobium sp.]
MLLARVIDASEAVTATRSRTTKVATLAQALLEAAAEPDATGHTIEVLTDYLAGTVPQRRLGVSWRGLRELPPPVDEAQLSLDDTDEALTDLAAEAGGGVAERRRRAIRDLFSRATAREQHWLVGVITGELRQGASDGVILQAVAHAAQVDEAIVRGAVMRAGHAGVVARAALSARGADEATVALTSMSLQVGRPLRPMLAGSSPTVRDAVRPGQTVAVERKVDGIRMQAHLWHDGTGRQVRIFTRTLEDITDRVPEVVEELAALPADSAVVDGELIAMRADGRPEPFQVTGARTASSANPQQLRESVPLTTVLFDVLHRDGEDLLEEPASARWSALAALAPRLTVPRLVTDDLDRAEEFFAAQVAAGHEGVIVKSLDSPYAAGRRGEGWVKVKPRHTFDLVVTAVEWGSGRRRGLLSNIHLAARDQDGEGLVMLGKTFKGMTDEVLRWQTERFLALETHRSGHVVHVRPEQVVEIAIDGIQRSQRYPGGIALRFARVVRYRDDKPVAQVDSLQQVLATCGAGL